MGDEEIRDAILDLLLHPSKENVRRLNYHTVVWENSHGGREATQVCRVIWGLIEEGCVEHVERGCILLTQQGMRTLVMEEIEDE